MFIFTHPVYPRRPWERGFKQAYNIGLILNFAAFVITFTNWYARIPNTFENYHTSTKFQLSRSLVDVLTGCANSAEITINGITATVSINVESLPYLFLTLQHVFVGVFTVHGLLIGTDFLAKTLFALNIHNWRYRGINIPINTFLSLAVVLYSVAVVALIGASQSARQFVQEYVTLCTKRFLVSNEARFVAAESDVEVVFGTNLYFILAAVVVNLFFYACACCHLIIQGSKESNSRLLQLAVPWESGFFGKPNKLLLIEYCRSRKEAEERIMLMNDDQFNAFLKSRGGDDDGQPMVGGDGGAQEGDGEPVEVVSSQALDDDQQRGMADEGEEEDAAAAMDEMMLDGEGDIEGMLNGNDDGGEAFDVDAQGEEEGDAGTKKRHRHRSHKKHRSRHSRRSREDGTGGGGGLEAPTLDGDELALDAGDGFQEEEPPRVAIRAGDDEERRRRKQRKHRHRTDPTDSDPAGNV